MKKEALILVATLVGCSQEGDKQSSPDEKIAVDTVQIERAYCASCGRLCEKFGEATGSFKRNTGEKLYFIRIRCPNVGFLNTCTDTYEQISDLGPYSATKEQLDSRGIEIREE